MNIDELTGVEFEQLCKKMLEEHGFRVETTKASGDGGIDLIAYSDKIFYSGKYIIQCKRYIGSVGEPVIRDLYGVVTAERANKGILITSGTFTNAAIKFSENKPIELIDMVILNKIIENDNHTDDVSVNDSILDTDTYNYYMNRISDSKCEYTTIVKFLDFILYNIIDKEAENQQQVIFNDIRESYHIDEIEFREPVLIRLNEINSINMIKSIEPKYINNDIVNNIELGLAKLTTSKFCRTKLGEIYYREIALKYGGITQLLSLNIETYFEERLKYMEQYQGRCYPGNFSYNYESRNSLCASKCELFNLYSLCNFFEYYIGIEKLNIKYPNYMMDSELKFNNFDYQNIISSRSAIIIYPQISFFSIGGKKDIYKNYYNRINFTSYFDKFISEERKAEIVKKIEFLLSI